MKKLWRCEVSRGSLLDFFGLILWDLAPTNSNDINQIEVVRGPASAVWGAPEVQHRRNNFDITLAPAAEDRNEIGA